MTFIQMQCVKFLFFVAAAVGEQSIVPSIGRSSPASLVCPLERRGHHAAASGVFHSDPDRKIKPAVFLRRFCTLPGVCWPRPPSITHCRVILPDEHSRYSSLGNEKKQTNKQNNQTSILFLQFTPCLVWE